MHKYLKGAGKRLSSIKFSTLVPFLVLAAGAFIVIIGLGIGKKLLATLGLRKPPDEQAYDKLIEKGVIDVTKGAEKSISDQYAKQASTKTDAEWLLIARKIADDLHVHLDKNVEDAGFQLCRVQNDTDVFKLVQAFGEKSVYAFGIPYKTLNLPGMVQSEISDDKIKKINANYASKGIKFRF